MGDNQPRSGNRQFFFRTLPENIATSPTGIVKISNSPFPSLDPSRQFRSVYERAGFDVYKPNKSKGSSRVTSPTNDHGFRSQSAAQLNQPPNSSFPRVMDEKRNMSEHQNVGQESNYGLNYGGKVTGFNKAPLNIDANLANASQNGELSVQVSTPSAATSTSDRLGGRQQFSSTSTTFTDAGKSTSSSRTSLNGNDISQNQFVSAQSLPYSGKTERNSKDSVPTFQGASSSNQPASGSPDEYSFAHKDTKHEPYARSIQPQSPYNQNSFNNQDSYQNDFEQPSTGFNDEAETSINTVKYTPNGGGNRNSQLQLQTHEDLLQGSTMDKSLETFNPISNSTNIDQSFNNGTPLDEDDFSDEASFKSEILSPKFNFETSKENAEDLTSNHDDLARDLQLNLPPSPQKHQHQEPFFEPHAQSSAPPIPQLFVSDTDGNVQYQDSGDSQSPLFNQNSRQSAVSVAASSIYSNEDKNEPLTLAQIPDTIEENEEEYEDAQYDQPSQCASQQSQKYATQYDDTPQSGIQNSQQYNDRYDESPHYGSQQPQQYEDYNDDYDLQPKHTFDDEYDDSNTGESSGPVYEEIEQQLETLSMRSPQPPQIMIHSVKEVSTEDISNPREAPEPPLHRRLASEVSSSDEHQQNGHYNGYQGDHQDDLQREIQREINEQEQYHDAHGSINEQQQTQETPQQEYQEPEIPKWPPGEGPCRKCGLEIERKPIYSKSGELSGQWHRECFTCTLCDLKFNKNTTCFVFKDLPYCEYHYHWTNNSLCKVCGSGIVGKCLENDANDRYHIDCLKCTKCGDQIKSDYLSINNNVHCESCAFEYTSNTHLGAENDLIERRRTKLFYLD